MPMTKTPTEILVGAKVKTIRKMTKREMATQFWEAGRCSLPPIVIVLDNGAKIFASRDDEGNGAGVMFGEFKKSGFYVMPD